MTLKDRIGVYRQGSLNVDIVADVVAKAQNRKRRDVVCCNVKHAQGYLDLPPNNSMMLGGDINMDKQIRTKLINDFKAEKFKYIVSVGTLTTGFDAPHVDTIAVLRTTERVIVSTDCRARFKIMRW